VILKGVILAGGSGSRLFPATVAVNKQLLPVYDKPMIYYAVTTLLSASINEICIICNEGDLPGYEALLGDGSDFGSRVEFIIQHKPEGIPQAITLASDFIGTEPLALILGDNIFVDHGDIRECVENFKSGATIFGIKVSQPEKYGVVEFNSKLKPTSLEEKPKNAKSSFAIPGFYLLDNNSLRLVKKLKKSSRGEFEIVDLLNIYLDVELLSLSLLSRGTGWIDAGTVDDLALASRYIEVIQQMHGIMIGSPHEAALVRGFIDREGLLKYTQSLEQSRYRKYLETVARVDFECTSANPSQKELREIDD
jgi:glucose-1-phosphate thymidylyltransferase